VAHNFFADWRILVEMSFSMPPNFSRERMVPGMSEIGFSETVVLTGIFSRNSTLIEPICDLFISGKKDVWE
jgi:hypothetical protein